MFQKNRGLSKFYGLNLLIEFYSVELLGKVEIDFVKYTRYLGFDRCSFAVPTVFLSLTKFHADWRN